MRIHFTSTDLAQRAAKRLTVLLGTLPVKAGFPSPSQKESQDIVAYMLGYDNWQELETVTKQTKEPSLLDEDSERMRNELLAKHDKDEDDKALLEAIQPYATRLNRQFFQASRLIEITKIPYDHCLSIAKSLCLTRNEPSSMAALSTNQVWTEISDNGTPTYHYAGSARSQLLNDYAASIAEQFMFDEISLKKTLKLFEVTTRAHPEFIEAYWRAFTCCEKAGDYEAMADVRTNLKPLLDKAVPDFLFNNKVEGSFQWFHLPTRALYRAVVAYVSMAYAEKEYDEARKWINFLLLRFPGMNGNVLKLLKKINEETEACAAA
jgi:hypothetical protein